MQFKINYIHTLDCYIGLDLITPGTVDCCVTSPPYFGLRDYGVPPSHWPEVTYSLFGRTIVVPPMTCCLGLEENPEAFIGHMVAIFRKVHTALKKKGTVWINMGDSYNSNAGGYSKSGDRGKHTYISETTAANILKTTRMIKELKNKDLLGIPWMLAFALREDGWYLRQDIIWHKPNPMPESVTDRCTKAHEYIFLLSKSEKYYFDQVAIKSNIIVDERVKYACGRAIDGSIDDVRKGQGSDLQKAKTSWNGSSFDTGKTGEMKHTNGHRKSGNKARVPASERGIPGAMEGATTGAVAANVPWEGMKANKRSVWTVTTTPFKEAHYATFPEKLIVDCIKAGCPENGIVLDPFSGAGTTPMVAAKLNRNYIAFELKPENVEMSNRRLYDKLGIFNKTI